MRDWEHSALPYCYLYTGRSKFRKHEPFTRWMVHVDVYGRCANCSQTLDDIWRILAAAEKGVLDMPSLSDIMPGAETTWGDQYDKGALRGIPFWIHGCRVSDYKNEKDEDVSLLVLDITLNGSNRHDPHAVITVGNSPERAAMLAYFNNPNGNREAIGPVHCFEVPLKAGRSFWRIEDYDAEILQSAALADQLDANGDRMLPAGKR